MISLSNLHFSTFSAVEQNELAAIYGNVEEKCRQFTTKMLAFVVFQQFPFLIAVAASIYNIHIGNFDTSTYFLPLRVARPFDIDTLPKWYLFNGLQFSFGITYILCVVVVTAYFVCCCFYLQALCDHFNYLIGMVDAELQTDRANPWASSLKARKLLKNTIDHHNNIYECVGSFPIYHDFSSSQNRLFFQYT